MQETSHTRFNTTHWSLVEAAGDPGNPRYAEALEGLCRHYWYPVYAYARRHGASDDEAKDLVQSFFTRVLEKNTVSFARRERGRFRTYLLTSFKNHWINEREKKSTLKRGAAFLDAIEWSVAETFYRQDQPEESNPERVFERRWALTLLERAMQRLRDEIDRSPRPDFSHHLLAYLTHEGKAATYRETAHHLATSEGSVKVQVHRLRKRYGEFVRDEVARTVDDRSEIDTELRYLFDVLG